MVRVVLRPWAILDVVSLPEFLSACVTVRSKVAPIGPVATVAAGFGSACVAAVASLQRRL